MVSVYLCGQETPPHTSLQTVLPCLLVAHNTALVGSVDGKYITLPFHVLRGTCSRVSWCRGIWLINLGSIHFVNSSISSFMIFCLVLWWVLCDHYFWTVRRRFMSCLPSHEIVNALCITLFHHLSCFWLGRGPRASCASMSQMPVCWLNRNWRSKSQHQWCTFKVQLDMLHLCLCQIACVLFGLNIRWSLEYILSYSHIKVWGQFFGIYLDLLQVCFSPHNIQFLSMQAVWYKWHDDEVRNQRRGDWPIKEVWRY